MGKNRSPQRLEKFFTYVLGRRPDEFGLVPDADGFVKIKDLLKAVSEEQGWGYVRRSHINEILFTLPAPAIEVREDGIRATNRENLIAPSVATQLPKILFTCIRRKAHAAVLQKGIHAQSQAHILLSSSREMAERIGKRKDPQPVLLQVHTAKSRQEGIDFLHAGELLYLADRIPTDCFTAPPLPKQKTESEKPTKPLKEEDYIPGSFYLRAKADKPAKKNSGKSKDKEKQEHSWKKDKKRLRKQKEKIWPV